MARDNEEKQDYLAAILGFDNTELLFEQGFKLTLHLRQIAPSEDCPHRFSYECNLFPPNSAGNAVFVFWRPITPMRHSTRNIHMIIGMPST